MCYSAGSIIQECPMCKVFPLQKCPHIRDTCRNRAAHPRMDVLYLKNAEVESFKGCGFCKWANQHPPPTKTGYNNPGWPGCCRAPFSDEFDKIPPADWPAISKVHAIPIPTAIETIFNALLLPPLALKTANGHQSSLAGSLRSPSRSASRKGNGAAINVVKSNTKPVNVPNTGRGRQAIVIPNTSRSSSSTGISSSLPNSPANESVSRRKATTATMAPTRNGESPNSSQSSPSRKSVELESPTPRRHSSARRPTLTPATTSVSVSKVVASDTSRSSELRQDSPTTSTSSRRGSSSSAPNSTIAASRNGDSFLVPRSSKADIDCRSSSSGSSDGMLSDSTITSEGFTDYLSDESEEEIQRQAEARAAVMAQSQMEELEFKMARQQLVRVGLEPPKSWTETNTPAVPPTKNTINQSSRNPKIPHSFAVAATAMMQTGQARG